MVSYYIILYYVILYYIYICIPQLMGVITSVIPCTHVQTPKCTRVATAVAIVDLPSHAQVVDLDPAGSSDPKIIENHHLQWVNPPFSIAILT